MIVLLVFLLLGTAIIAIQFPAVQTKLANKATSYLSDKIGFPIVVEGVSINWFDEIVLEGVTVHDPRKGQMVYLKELVVDYRIISLTAGKFNVDKVTLRNGRVNLIRYAPDGMTNLTDFIDAIRELTTPKQKSARPVAFTIDEVELDNMLFTYHDQRKPYLNHQFDHHHFALDSIFAQATSLRIIADTFQINVSHLQTKEPSIDLRVHALTTLFTLTKRDMEFDNLSASIGESKVKNYLRFNYNDINDLSDFNTRIDVTANLDESLIDFRDLSEFAPELRSFREKAILTAELKGKVENFTAKNMNLAFGTSSRIKGQIYFKGLPEFQETFIEFMFKNSAVHAADLKQYVDTRPYEVLKKFGTISGSGEFVGFPQDFVTKGSFNTGLGKLDSDIRLNAKEALGKPEYHGQLKTYAFNLGKLLDLKDYVQLIDMDGKIEGAGFRLDEAEMNLDADIKRIGINNYNYRNIKTNAKLSEKTFNGFLSVKDSNLVFDANGKIDFTREQEIFDIRAHVAKANLKPLQLSPVETMFRTDVVLNFKGTDIDEIIGRADFKNTYLLYHDNKELYIDSLYLYSALDGNHRKAELKSDLVSLKAEGDFNYTGLVKDLQRLYKEYAMNVENDKSKLNNYYANQKSINHDKYHLDLFVHIKNLNSIFEIYAPGLYMSQGFTVEGNFIHGNNAILNLYTHFDTLIYKENEIYHSDIQISTSKLADSANVLAMIYATSGNQKFGSIPSTSNLVMEGIWENGDIDFTTRIQETNTSNKLDLKGRFSFLDNQKMLTFTNSSIEILDKRWRIAEDNKIFFGKNELGFKNFALGNRDQFIAINGTISENADKVAEVKIGNFDIQALNSLLEGYKLSGILNGNIAVRDLFHELDLSGSLNIKNFSLDGFLLGDVKGKSRWDNNAQKLLVDVELARDEVVTVGLNGYVHSNKETGKDELNLLANLDNADLEILAPLVKDVMSGLSGKATGTFKVEGDIKNVTVKGKADIRQGQFKVDYLGTTYHFDDAIYLDENRIGFKNLKLRDEFENIGILSGGLEHDGFRNFIVDISGTMHNMHVLNTSEKDNNLFYGNAFVTGDMEILGPLSNLAIKANARSNKGTRISIPLNSYSGLEENSFVVFKPREKLVKEEKEEKNEDVDLSGISLDFNFEVTPDAYAEIIFDKRTGDIIHGYGNGNIKMAIDTRGDFTMFGNYRMVKGGYNYTLAGLISKEFTIEPNSSISWTGDPYGGILDVKAYFESKVTIAPLMISAGYDSAQVANERLRTNPVKVLLDIEGDLMSPQIGLDIDILPTTQEASIVAAKFESDIKRNEQELNRQVFSLLVLGNFSSPTSFSGTGGAASNLSQLLTNQLSNWLSQVDENLIIDINLNGLDKDALSTFNLRLSYTLLDGRLRISRDGTFSNYQNPSQTQNLSNIAGEWTVEYLLNKDGQFRLKLYNKNNQNYLLNNFNSGSFTSAGFSLLHTQSFNTLDELLWKSKKKQKKETIPAPADTPGQAPDQPQDNDKPASDTTLLKIALPKTEEDED